MKTDKEFNELINEKMVTFKGHIPDFFRAVGMLYVGRRYGWRVMRLVASQSVWSFVKREFGDPKDLMPERGDLYHKSVGIRAVDTIGDYWGVIRRQVPIAQGVKVSAD
jgi:hypothetical protein